MINRDTMKVHMISPEAPNVTLCAWAFLTSGADWVREPSNAQALHRGKRFSPCGECRRAALRKGWLAPSAAGAESAPSSSSEGSSASES